LLESLDYAYQNVADLRDKNNHYYLYMYAMFLLAEFRVKAAFPRLTAILGLSSEEIECLLGDILTEDFYLVLSSTFEDGNMHMLFHVIENPELYEYARISALRACEQLYRNGCTTQEEFVLYLRGLIYDKLSPDDLLFTHIIGSIIDCRLFQMIPDAVYLYDNDYVDTTVNGAFDDFIDFLFNKEQKEVSGYIVDTVAEMEHWACFKQEPGKRATKGIEDDLSDFLINQMLEDKKQDKIMQQKYKKVGRNDPCPCGSGKKYKNCCLNTQRPAGKPINRVEDKYDLLKDYPKDLPLFNSMYEEESVAIDMLVYKALHHRAIPVWVQRDYAQERLGKIAYLNEALNLFLEKCSREGITTFAAYDDHYMVHYRSYEWVSSLLNLIKDSDPESILDVKEAAEDTLENFA